MKAITLVPRDIHHDVTEVLSSYASSTLPVYAEAEKIRRRRPKLNIALEDIIALFVEGSGQFNVSIAFDPSEAREAVLGLQATPNEEVTIFENGGSPRSQLA